MVEESNGGATRSAGSGSRTPARGQHPFGWRAGIALGIVVLVAVYAIAELTALLPPLRDAVEHLPVAISVLVIGTVGVLLAVLVRPRAS